MQKLYCYVDETGQDARSTGFLVSVVIFGNERDTALTILEQIEQETGKGNVKWVKANDTARVDYIVAVLRNDFFRAKLYYAVYPRVKNPLPRVVEATAESINVVATDPNYKATVLVDGLHKSQVQTFGNLLHERGIRTRKVRGIKDETDALIRLPDALSGFVRAAGEGRGELQKLLERAKRDGIIREI